MEEFDVERYERSIERGLLDSFDREFDADEDIEFLDNLCVILGDYLNPSSAIYWSQDLTLFSPAWRTRAERRQYIEAALDRTAGMIVARGWDPTPLFWVTKYIGEYKNREASKVEEVFDLLQRLSIAITGKSSRWLRLYDEETTGQPANDQNSSPPASADSGRANVPATKLPKVNLKTNQVRYGGGECLDVTSDGALLMSELVKNHPHPIKASEFLTKPSRTKDELPEILRKLIDTAPGKGYWLKI